MRICRTGEPVVVITGVSGDDDAATYVMVDGSVSTIVTPVAEAVPRFP